MKRVISSLFAIALLAPFARAQSITTAPDGAIVIEAPPAVAPAPLPTVSGTAVAAPATPTVSKAFWFFPAGYFGFVGQGNIQSDVLSVYQVRSRSLIGAQTDIALVTHSTATTVMPAFLRGKGVPSIPWCLAAGGGGSLTGNAFINLNVSVNWTSVIATTIVGYTGRSSSPVAAGVTDFFTQGLALPGGAGTLGFAGGLGLGGQIVNEGHFQNFAAAFPGRGPGAILENAAVYTLGLSWKTL